MYKLKRVLGAIWNADGLWAILGIWLSVLVGYDFIDLVFAEDRAWYGALVFLMFIVHWTYNDSVKVIKRYKGEL